MVLNGWRSFYTVMWQCAANNYLSFLSDCSEVDSTPEKPITLWNNISRTFHHSQKSPVLMLFRGRLRLLHLRTQSTPSGRLFILPPGGRRWIVLKEEQLKADEISYWTITNHREQPSICTNRISPVIIWKTSQILKESKGHSAGNYSKSICRVTVQ